jgi:hypothetical protein
VHLRPTVAAHRTFVRPGVHLNEAKPDLAGRSQAGEDQLDSPRINLPTEEISIPERVGQVPGSVDVKQRRSYFRRKANTNRLLDCLVALDGGAAANGTDKCQGETPASTYWVHIDSLLPIKGLPNFVFSCSFAPLDVFRKQRRVVYFQAPDCLSV